MQKEINIMTDNHMETSAENPSILQKLKAKWSEPNYYKHHLRAGVARIAIYVGMPALVGLGTYLLTPAHLMPGHNGDKVTGLTAHQKELYKNTDMSKAAVEKRRKQLEEDAKVSNARRAALASQGQVASESPMQQSLRASNRGFAEAYSHPTGRLDFGNLGNNIAFTFVLLAAGSLALRSHTKPDKKLTSMFSQHAQGLTGFTFGGGYSSKERSYNLERFEEQLPSFDKRRRFVELFTDKEKSHQTEHALLVAQGQTLEPRIFPAVQAWLKGHRAEYKAIGTDEYGYNINKWVATNPSHDVRANRYPGQFPKPNGGSGPS